MQPGRKGSEKINGEKEEGYPTLLLLKAGLSWRKGEVLTLNQELCQD